MGEVAAYGAIRFAIRDRWGQRRALHGDRRRGETRRFAKRWGGKRAIATLRYVHIDDRDRNGGQIAVPKRIGFTRVFVR
jgi:hypothetical protein